MSNSFKRYASEQYVDERFKAFQPDWNQNDENQEGFVTNRTHFKTIHDPIFNEIVDARKERDTSTCVYGGEIDRTLNLVEGQYYIVEFNGNSYICECKSNYAAESYKQKEMKVLYLGNVNTYWARYIHDQDSFNKIEDLQRNLKLQYGLVDTGEPFLIEDGHILLQENNTGICFYTDEVGKYRFKIYQVDYKTLDDNYLSDNIVKKSNYPHADFYESDVTSPAYIKNKPCYADFSGTTKLLEYFNWFSEGPLHVGTSFQTVESISLNIGDAFTLIVDNEIYKGIAVDASMLMGDGAIGFGDKNTFTDDIMIPSDPEAPFTIAFKIDENVLRCQMIYASRTLEHPHTCILYKGHATITPIKEMFLPSYLQNLTWDTLKNRPFGEEGGNIKLVDNEVLTTDAAGGAYDIYLYLPSFSFTPTIGTTYVVNLNGTDYTCIATDASDIITEGAWYIGNVEYLNMQPVGDIPFVIVGFNGQLQIATSKESETQTISITEISEPTTKKIDEKYIPDTIARVSDLSTSSKPDWNQNDETAADYIKNRPVYDNGISTYEVIPALDETSYYYQYYDGSDWNSYDGIYTLDTMSARHAQSPRLGLVEGLEYSLVIDGVTYTDVAKTVVDANYLNSKITYFGTYDTSDENFVFCVTDGFNMYDPYSGLYSFGYIIKIKSDTQPAECKIIMSHKDIKKLDIKYLPENGFGYSEVGIGEIIPETIFDGTSFTMASQAYRLSLGKTYIVKLDGIEYECIPKTEESVLYLGNYDLFGIGDDTGEPFSVRLEQGYTDIRVSTNGTHTFSLLGETDIIHKIDPKYMADLKIGYAPGNYDIATHSASEIYKAYSQGYNPYFDANGMLMYSSMLSSDVCTFYDTLDGKTIYMEIDNNKNITFREVAPTHKIDNITASVGQTIVVKSIDDNGHPIEWEAVDMPNASSGLPPYTAEDEGKILRIVNGVPTWVSLPNAEEASF